MGKGLFDTVDPHRWIDPPKQPGPQPEHVSVEIWRRIRVAVWAYAYEVESNPLTSDAEFDSECLKVRPEMHTSYHGRDNRKIDAWWRKNFRPNTGSWINGHPDLKGIRKYYLLWKDQKSYHLAKQKWSYYKTYAKHRIERVCRRVREAHYYETYAESRKRRKR